MNNLKFKDWAYLSGYPLENEVEQILKRVCGQAAIKRNIEFDVNYPDGKIIRSIDFLVEIQKDSRNIPNYTWTRGRAEKIQLSILLDAKYSQDDERYMFIPSENTDVSCPFLIPKLIKDSFSMEVNHHRIDLIEFSKLEINKVASSGRKVKELTRERDSVTGTVTQMVQGLCYYLDKMSSTLGSTSHVDSNYGRDVFIFLPIIVVNAPLLVMEKGTLLNDIYKAQNESEIFDSEEIVALEMPKSQEIYLSWEQAKKSLNRSQNPILKWHEKGLGEGFILFANISGLEKLLTQTLEKFAAIKDDILRRD